MRFTYNLRLYLMMLLTKFTLHFCPSQVISNFFDEHSLLAENSICFTSYMLIKDDKLC